jgi:hypothetical protein
MPSTGVQIEEYCQQYEVETVKMWRQSFQRAMGLEEHNRLHELTDHLEYFRSLDPSLSKGSCRNVLGKDRRAANNV